MAKKKLHEITEIPEPSAEKLEAAKKAGVELVAHHPDRVQAFLHGHVTLGELEGIGKEAQYQMAKIGFDYIREGKLDQAKKVFEGLQALDPYDAYFHSALGAVVQELGDHAQADKLYSRCLEINPFSVLALANRGEIRLVAGRVDEGIADLVKAVQEDPEGKDPAGRRARGLLTVLREQIEASRRDPAGAARQARKALEKQDPQAVMVAGSKLAKAPQPVPEAAPPKPVAAKAKAAPAKPAAKAAPVRGAPPTKSSPFGKKSEQKKPKR